MDETDAGALKSVEKTMLLPLWGRYTESKKENGLIRDEKCVEIVERMGLDFSGIQKQQHPLTRLAWVARAWNTDCEISRLVKEKGEITVVCLGCGLDTSYFRLSHDQLHWVDIDLPNVIKIRERLIGTQKGVTMIPGSVLQSSSFKGIKVKGYPVVLAVGLLCYFTRAEVKKIMENIAGTACEATLILDYFSEEGVQISNKIVLQSHPEVRMTWSAENPGEVCALHPGLRLVEGYPMFQKIFPFLSEEQQAMACVSDRRKINSMAAIKTGCLNHPPV